MRTKEIITALENIDNELLFMQLFLLNIASNLSCDSVNCALFKTIVDKILNERDKLYRVISRLRKK